MNLKSILKGIVRRQNFLENTLAECKHRDQASSKYVQKHCHTIELTLLQMNINF